MDFEWSLPPEVEKSAWFVQNKGMTRQIDPKKTNPPRSNIRVNIWNEYRIKAKDDSTKSSRCPRSLSLSFMISLLSLSYLKTIRHWKNDLQLVKDFVHNTSTKKYAAWNDSWIPNLEFQSPSHDHQYIKNYIQVKSIPIDFSSTTDVEHILDFFDSRKKQMPIYIISASSRYIIIIQIILEIQDGEDSFFSDLDLAWIIRKIIQHNLGQCNHNSGGDECE